MTLYRFGRFDIHRNYRCLCHVAVPLPHTWAQWHLTMHVAPNAACTLHTLHNHSFKEATAHLPLVIWHYSWILDVYVHIVMCETTIRISHNRAYSFAGDRATVDIGTCRFLSAMALNKEWMKEDIKKWKSKWKNKEWFRMIMMASRHTSSFATKMLKDNICTHNHNYLYEPCTRTYNVHCACAYTRPAAEPNKSHNYLPHYILWRLANMTFLL